MTTLDNLFYLEEVVRNKIRTAHPELVSVRGRIIRDIQKVRRVKAGLIS